MMMCLELLAELSDHLVVDIGTIVRNDPLWYTVSTDQIMRMNRATTLFRS